MPGGKEKEKIVIILKNLELVHRQIHAVLGISQPKIFSEALNSRLIDIFESEVGLITLDTSSGELLRDRQPVSRLSLIQLRIFSHLFSQPNVVSPLSDLFQVGWPGVKYFETDDRYLRSIIGTHVRRIRKALSIASPQLPPRLETVPQFGYRWSEPSLRIPEK